MEQVSKEAVTLSQRDRGVMETTQEQLWRTSEAT